MKLCLLLVCAAMVSAMTIQKNPLENDATKQFFIDMGAGFVDGVTFNLTNATNPVCKNEFATIGHVVDDARTLVANFDMIQAFAFMQNVTETWFSIAGHC